MRKSKMSSGKIEKDVSSIKAMIDVFIRRKWLIIGIFLASLTFAYLYSITKVKTYKLETFYKITAKDSNGDVVLTPDELYDILRTIDYEKINKKFADKSPVVRNIKINPLTNSIDKFKAVMEVTDKTICTEIVSEVCSYLNEVIRSFTNSDDCKINPCVVSIGSVSVFDSPRSRKIKRDLAVAALIGLIAGIFTALIVEDYRKSV
jgi:hypothetical protein